MSNSKSKKRLYSNSLACPKCSTLYSKIELGIYICRRCGYEEESILGRIRAYIMENEKATVSEISKALNVTASKINHYIKMGRIEIREDSSYFLACSVCKVSIRYGKYCPNCAKNLATDLAASLEEGEIGEIPVSKRDSNPKMRYLTVL